MTAEVLGLAPSQVRIVPSACGGGFGGKLDVSIQPLTALAAWLTGAPVACVYERPESMMASTKRHPAVIEARIGCDGDGKLRAVDFDATFDTGAYASWGPTVASRVPDSRLGTLCRARGHSPRSGLLHQRSAGRRLSRLRRAAGCHRPRGADGRPRRQARHGPAGASPQERAPAWAMPRQPARCSKRVPASSPAWRRSSRAGSVRSKTQPGPTRITGLCGAASASAACGTASATPRSATPPPCGSRSTGRAGSRSTTAAVDIGQGSTTILAQICADALGVAADRIRPGHRRHGLDRRRGQDLGLAARLSSRARRPSARGTALRAAILREANVADDATIELTGAQVLVRDGGRRGGDRP